MILLKKRSHLFLSLPIFMFLLPAWGMDEQEKAGEEKVGLKLNQKIAAYQFDKSKKKPVFHFTRLNGNSYPHEKVFYNISSFQNLLNYLGEEQCSMITKILEAAVTDPDLRKAIEREYPDNVGVIASIKNFLTYKNVISEDTVRTIFENYVDPCNEDEQINVTGSALTTDLLTDLLSYMEHCQAVYTDFATRDFLNKQNIFFIKNKWDTVINNRLAIGKTILKLEKLEVQYSSLKELSAVFYNESLFGTEQLPSEEPEQMRMNLDKFYKKFIAETLKGLAVINISLMDEIKELTKEKDIIVDNDYLNNSENRIIVDVALKKIKTKLDTIYGSYFNDDPKDARTWLQDLGATINDYLNYEIPKYPGPDEKMHQLTARAVIESSFLHKIPKLSEDNITVIDVGFRNQTTYGSWWNTFVTTAIKPIKSNKKAWFEECGEVDYVAYIEKDPENKTDKLVITYSGSNSAMDWGINFTNGHGDFHGLSVHQGIGWVLNESLKRQYGVLLEQLKGYYKNNPIPEKLVVVVTGHSLGGALAELAGFFYKTKIEDENFKKYIYGNNKLDIDVKVYTYAAPAIIHKNSKNRMESVLGKKNIYRVWIPNDIVVTWTDSSLLNDGRHVGIPFPLYNIQDHPANYWDFWVPHKTNSYVSALTSLKFKDHSEKHKAFIKILNDHINKNDLNVCKINLVQLRKMKESLTHHKPSEFVFSKNLVDNILKYSCASQLSSKCGFSFGSAITPLSSDIIRYLIDSPHENLDISWGARISKNPSTYSQITEAICNNNIDLLNYLINRELINKKFLKIEENNKEDKFKYFAKNFAAALSKFDCLVDNEIKKYPYKNEESFFKKYMEGLKNDLLNVSWSLKEEDGKNEM